MAISVILNALIVLLMGIALTQDLLKKVDGKLRVENTATFRFFTTDSNILSSLGALVMLICVSCGGVSECAVLFKFVGTAAVTVTLLTVMLFLGPTQGYKNMLGGWGMYVHLFGPLMAIVSLCFFEDSMRISFAQSMLGMIPVVLYGAVYMFQVVVRGEERGGWQDFYGFNGGGRWYVSIALMLLGAFGICNLLRFLYNL